MKLHKLKLENFKKIKKAEYNFNGKNACIIGRNEVGKTTYFDAFCYCITGKDSLDRSELNFGIKTKINNVTQHNLVHAVELTAEHEGNMISFRREFKEKWTKQRGKARKEFTGHVSNYYINEVPVKAGEFNDSIKLLLGNYFKLLTNTHYFNEVLSHKERRSFLIDQFGSISYTDVINSDEKYQLLLPLIAERIALNDEADPIEPILKMATSRRSKTNEILKEIPIKINENNNFIESYQEVDPNISNVIKNLEAEIEAKRDEIAKVKATAGNSALDKQILEATHNVEKEKLRIKISKDDHLKNYQNDRKEHFKKIEDIKNKAAQKQLSIDTENKSIASIENDITFYNTQIEEARVAFKKANASQFDTSNISDTCPTCGQPLNPEKLNATINSEKAKFSKAKVEKLQDINTKGKKWTDQVAKKNLDIAKHKSNIDKLNKQLDDINLELSGYELANFSEYKEPEIDYSDLEKAKLVLTELEQKRDSEEKIDTSSIIEPIEAAIAKLKEEVEDARNLESQYKNFKKSETRINELMKQEEELSVVLETNQTIIELCEDFTVTQMNMLSDLINKNFKIANFRLFEEQVNGGIAPTCIAVGKDGVAWNEGMNTGQKYNIGLDIIETFAAKLGYDLPVFIENAESITKVQDTDLQIIQLIQDRRFKDLVILQGKELEDYENGE